MPSMSSLKKKGIEQGEGGGGMMDKFFQFTLLLLAEYLL